MQHNNWRDTERRLIDALLYEGHTVRSTWDGPVAVFKFYDDETGEFLGAREIPLTPIARTLEFI